MILSFIKFRKSQAEPEKLWRFTTPKGSCDHLAVLCDTDIPLLDRLAESLQNLFAPSTERTSTSESYLSVGYSDDDGQSWRLDIQGQTRKAWCNGTPVDFIKAPGIRPGKAATGKSLPSIIQQVYPFKDSVSVRPTSLQQTQGFSEAFVMQHCLATADRVATLMDEPALKDPQQILALAERLGLCFVQLQEVENLIVKMRGQGTNLPDETAIRKLGDELLLIEKMRQLIATLNKGSENGKTLKAEIEKCEGDLAEITKQFGIVEDQIESLNKVDWGELIGASAKLESQTLLLRFGEEQNKVFSENLAPFAQSKLDSLQTVFDANAQFVQDLSRIVKQAADDAARPKSLTERLYQNLQGLLQRSIAERINAPLTALGQRLKLQRFSESSNSLELTNTQATIHDALISVGEILRRVDASSESLDQTVDQFHEQHEKLAKEVARSRTQWRIVAERNRLPIGLTLSQLVQLAGGHLALRQLLVRRDDLLARHQKRREQLIDLQKQVLEWRRHTGSQKQSDLKSATILMNEARSICQYAEEKEAAFRRLVETRENGLAKEAALAQLKIRQQDLLSHWQRTGQEIGIRDKSHQDGRWPQFLRGAQEIKALSNIHGETKETLLRDFLEAGADMNMLTIYAASKPQLTAAHLESSVDTLLAKGRSHGHHLLLLCQDTAQQTAANLGAAVSSLVIEKAGASVGAPSRPIGMSLSTTSSSATNTSPQKVSSTNSSSIISPRARAVLDLLNSPRTLPPKGPKLNSNS